MDGSQQVAEQKNESKLKYSSLLNFSYWKQELCYNYCSFKNLGFIMYTDRPHLKTRILNEVQKIMLGEARLPFDLGNLRL